MKRLIIIRPTDRQVSGRGRQGRLQKHFFFLFLSFRPLPSFLPSGLWPASASLNHGFNERLHCTALHCSVLTALLTRLTRSPLPLFRNGLTNKHSLRRRTDRSVASRRTPSTPFSLFAPPLIHSSQLKGGRKATATQEVFPLSLSRSPLFLLLQLAPSLPLSLSPARARSLSQSPRRFCPPLMPAARSEILF